MSLRQMSIVASRMQLLEPDPFGFQRDGETTKAGDAPANPT
jgi:hypothetical protein